MKNLYDELKKYSPIENIQNLVGLFLIYYFISPIFSFHNQFVFFFFVLCWFILALKNDYIVVTRAVKSKVFIFLCLFPIISIIYCFIGNSLLNKHVLLIPFMYLFAKVNSSEKYEKILNIYILFTLIYILFICAFTLIKLEGNPELTRLLARGDKDVIKHFVSPFTATYATVYTVMMIGIANFYYAMVQKQKIIRFLGIAFTLFICYFLFKSAYSISILIYIIGISIILLQICYVKAHNKKKFMISFLILSIIILAVYLLFHDVIADCILLLGNYTKDIMQQRRIREIAELVRNFGIETEGGMINRLKLYGVSLETFFNKPIFGVGFREELLSTTANVSTPMIGNHSTILDMLASFGIFGFFYIFSIPIYYYDLKNKIAKHIKGVYILLGLFIFLSLINTTHNINFYFVMLFYIPNIFFILERNGDSRRNRQ